MKTHRDDGDCYYNCELNGDGWGCSAGRIDAFDSRGGDMHGDGVGSGTSHYGYWLEYGDDGSGAPDGDGDAGYDHSSETA